MSGNPFVWRGTWDDFNAEVARRYFGSQAWVEMTTGSTERDQAAAPAPPQPAPVCSSCGQRGGPYCEPQPAPDLGAAHADLQSEIRIAVSLHCTGPGVPCDLCLRETDRAMKAIDAYARDIAQHERTREQPAPETVKKAVYCSGDLAIVGQDYSQPQHPRKVHEDGTLCDHSGPVRIGDTQSAPGPRPEIRTCYCGTTATVVPGTFPHSDCDGSVRTAPGPAPEPGTALYLSAIARLSAGLRDVRQACERGDASYAVRQVAAGALADAGRLRLPQPEPEPAVAAGTEHGPVGLRPALSATVVVAAGSAIDDDRKAMMLAAFAQDGLRAVFVEDATAIGELPPDPALRADIEAMAARWKDQAATHRRDADKATLSALEAAVLLAKARVYDANATEVREAIGGEPGA